MTATSNSDVARFLAPIWLVGCVLLGGSSSGGVVANGLLQVAAGGIAIWLIQRGIWSTLDRPARFLLTIVAVAVLIALLSLVPLPPTLWAMLPGRDNVARAYDLVGMARPWLPLSMTPDATIATMFSLLPPLAMFLLIRAATPEQRRVTLITLVVAAFISVLFGVVQQVSGFQSNTYIYQYTSRGGAVGFFANRNHLATLCLMTMPFLAAMAAGTRKQRDGQFGWTVPIAMLLLLAVGALVVQSLAGWILLIPTALACALLFLGPRRGRSSQTLMVAMAAGIVVAILVVLFAPLSPTDLGQAGEIRPQARRAIMGLTWQAARHFWLVGTGWGSFVTVFPMFENRATITDTFINHAHNDYLEVLLEWGIAGVGLMLAFLVWWSGRLRDAWQQGGDPIARAATVSIGVVLAHSFVDYPARTATIACVAALCCGLAGVRTSVVQAQAPRRQRERTTGTIMLGPTARPRRGQAGDKVT